MFLIYRTIFLLLCSILLLFICRPVRVYTVCTTLIIYSLNFINIDYIISEIIVYMLHVFVYPYFRLFTLEILTILLRCWSFYGNHLISQLVCTGSLLNHSNLYIVILKRFNFMFLFVLSLLICLLFLGSWHPVKDFHIGCIVT